MSTPISVGIFDYINVWPVYYDFLGTPLGQSRDCPRGVPGVSQKWRLVWGTPTELNERFRQGELSISPLSSNQLPFLQDDAQVLPTIALATHGQVGSVMMISENAIGKLHGQEILTTRASSTSIALLKIILHKLKINAHVTLSNDPLSALKRERRAVLLIGDEALHAYQRFDGYFRHDLGQYWAFLTGKPFVWALWGIGKTTPETVTASLEQSLDHGLENLKSISEAASKRLGIDSTFIEKYYRNFQYRLTDEHIDGLLHFYKLAHELDLGPKCESIRFAETAKIC